MVKTHFEMNLILVLLILTAFVAACSMSNSRQKNSGIFPDFGFADESEDARALVKLANEDLLEIRKIQKANAGKLDDLKNALRERDTASAQGVLDTLIAAIESGLSHGETALARVDEAASKRINEVFAEYLRLKKEAFRKQIDAYEFRLKVAKGLRDKLGTTDSAALESAKADFERDEENFDKLWKAATELHDRANRLAREKPAKVKAQ